MSAIDISDKILPVLVLVNLLKVPKLFKLVQEVPPGAHSPDRWWGGFAGFCPMGLIRHWQMYPMGWIHHWQMYPKGWIHHWPMTSKR